MVRLKPKIKEFLLFVLIGLNSTMVRLKQKQLIEINCSDIESLNSTMVRLKQREYDNSLIYEKASQFHYGSIKTMSKSKLSSLKKKSQFHYGSIKTYDPSLIYSRNDLSQFHYGSIKTKMKKKHINKRFVSLNSTMVRLKRYLSLELMTNWNSLNSTMVRLKLETGGIELAVSSCLNSTMVRLKL